MVSVVIPVYNREPELKRAIKSVLSQTIQDLEILVIDDFSEIDLKKTCAEFNDVRIKYHRLDKKGNGNVCRNLGIKLATGEYIAMLDSDDEWLNDHLELKLKNISQTKADGLFGSLYVNDGSVSKKAISRPLKTGEKFVNYILSDGSAQTSSYFFKTNCAKSILWDESLLRHQDYDYSVKFAAKYDFRPTEDLTCIVHWQKGTVRDQSIESQIKFMSLYKKDIMPVLYNQYFRNLYLQIGYQEGISNELKQITKKESTYYFKFCSLNDYLSVNGTNKGTFFKFLLRLEFILKTLIA